MVKVYIDADACPVKAEAEKVATRYKTQLLFVSNSGGRPSPNPFVTHIMVAEGADAADDWIVDQAGAGDIVVTADIPLAARALEKKALVINHTGSKFDEVMIGNALAMRDLKSQLRDEGVISGGGRSFSKQDRSHFLQVLDNLLSKAVKK